MKFHELKSWPEYFRCSVGLKKDFEVRKNDRDFKKGDEVCLREWDPAVGSYTGRSVNGVIGEVFHLDNLGLAGYVVFGIKHWHNFQPGWPQMREYLDAHEVERP